jgi:hypothetical protein
VLCLCVVSRITLGNSWVLRITVFVLGLLFVFSRITWVVRITIWQCMFCRITL